MTQLDYATFSADGLPDLVPAAEDAINAGGGPDAIKQFFKKSRDASLYYAKSISRRFVQDDQQHNCCACDSPADRSVTLNWIAFAKPNGFEFKWSDNSNAVPIETHHLLCNQCILKWKRKNIVPKTMLVVLNWLVALLILGVVVGNIWLIPYQNIAILFILPLVILGHLGRFIFRKLLLRCLPAPMRWLVRKGIRLVGQKIEDQNVC